MSYYEGCRFCHRRVPAIPGEWDRASNKYMRVAHTDEAGIPCDAAVISFSMEFYSDLVWKDDSLTEVDDHVERCMFCWKSLDECARKHRLLG